MPHPSIRRNVGEALHEFARENGATHFGTLKVGLIGRARIDMHRDLLRPLGIVLREYGRDRRDLPKRATVEASDVPFLAGVVEQYDRAGSLDPHLHYFISLESGEEPRYRGFLRRRFGRDATMGAASLPAVAYEPFTRADMRPFIFPTPVSVSTPPVRRIIARRDAQPSFDLQQLSDDWEGAASYSAKQSSTPDIITHSELLSI